MLEYIEKEMNMTLTENGAATYTSTGSDCLDLFAAIGALRRDDDAEIVSRFIRAYTENPNVAMKILFFARDIRGGLGERRVFRTIIRWMAFNEPESVRKNIAYIAEFGRFDDLLAFVGTPCEKEAVSYLKGQFDADMEALKENRNVSLLAKWLPSVNASNSDVVRTGKKLAKAFGLSDAEYRRSLSALRAGIRIIENNLREKDYTFDYEKQPSRAMYKYRRAFMRNDADRYDEFISKVVAGEASLNTENVAPYELVESCLNTGWMWSGDGYMKKFSAEEKKFLNATWASLPDYGGDENVIAVIDTSGSMYCDARPCPAAVALSLGLYFAERNKGVFADCFIEFSARPKLIKIKGETFAERLRYVTSFNEIANTNLEAVFDVILRAAVKNHVSQEELPDKLIIISDMEFDACVDKALVTNFENAKMKYAAQGYVLPQIIFWNVASRNRQQPVTQNEQGVALISGATPKIFEMVAGGQLSPYAFMMEILERERYAKIVA
ncbi:MAG: DUF2828 family protein [Lachnospiraceae bacterium]|nr:DUF2828 family protein [Lachnospiraceae bacterium]